MPELNVFLNDELVGVVHSSGGGVEIGFRYSDSWIERDRYPISQSLPVQKEELSGRTFFANLLPEENVRTRICKKLGISEGNDFELLKAIGGDCAGASTVTPTDVPAALQNEYSPIEEKQLADWSIGAPDASSAIAGQSNVRLSLAGAQDKLPVKAMGSSFYLPEGNSPSTHILKFASPDYSHLPENETFTTMLAKSVSVNAVDIELYQTREARIEVVVRYDRKAVDSGTLRIHQEDFCQALGINPTNKYEKEGGPGIRDCGGLIKRVCTVPATELEKLIRWAIFNLLVHNADAHGKNISLIYDSEETILAPFYDLVCTRNYERLDRKLAMKIGGVDDPDVVQKKHLEAMAKELEVRESFVTDMTVEMGERLMANLPAAVEEFRGRFGDSPILQRIPKVVTKRVRKTLQSFK